MFKNPYLFPLLHFSALGDCSKVFFYKNPLINFFNTIRILEVDVRKYWGIMISEFLTLFPDYLVFHGRGGRGSKKFAHICSCKLYPNCGRYIRNNLRFTLRKSCKIKESARICLNTPYANF